MHQGQDIACGYGTPIHAAKAGTVIFAGVMSGPLVRSSYRAGRLYRQVTESRDLRVGAGQASPQPAV